MRLVLSPCPCSGDGSVRWVPIWQCHDSKATQPHSRRAHNPGQTTWCTLLLRTKHLSGAHPPPPGSRTQLISSDVNPTPPRPQIHLLHTRALPRAARSFSISPSVRLSAMSSSSALLLLLVAGLAVLSPVMAINEPLCEASAAGFELWKSHYGECAGQQHDRLTLLRLV